MLALTDPAGYAAQFPGCDIRSGDVNVDGRVDFGDINPFVGLLSGAVAFSVHLHRGRVALQRPLRLGGADGFTAVGARQRVCEAVRGCGPISVLLESHLVFARLGRVSYVLTPARDHLHGQNMFTTLRRALCGMSLGALLGLSAVAPADEIRWLGGTGNWSDPNYWSGGVVPTSGDRALIDGGLVQVPSVVLMDHFAWIWSLVIDPNDELHVNQCRLTMEQWNGAPPVLENAGRLLLETPRSWMRTAG